jgi:hypothetical protein
MPGSWTRALNLYCYPVDLGGYQRRSEFPGFFGNFIAGDRYSTIAFENHFRENAQNNIAAYLEVVFWKLYSQPQWRQRATNSIVNYILEHNVQPGDLWDAISKFVENQTIRNLRGIRTLLGIKTNVLAVPLTFPALTYPEEIPMIDKQVANWVNLQGPEHSENTNNTLSNFNLNYTSLRENDFDNYLNWIAWCKEISEILTRLTKEKWRARDVEMAVFTAQRNNLLLNPLPRISGT